MRWLGLLRLGLLRLGLLRLGLVWAVALLGSCSGAAKAPVSSAPSASVDEDRNIDDRTFGYAPASTCNSTETCREQQAKRNALFARAVAAEPPAQRAAVERVAEHVLVDRAGGVVWALDPELVVLDLRTGGERWRNKAIRGDALWRAGRWLISTAASKGHTAEVGVIDLEDAAKTHTCTLTLPSPEEATSATLTALDRRGVPHLVWQSAAYSHGGTPPGPAQIAERNRALSCGIVALDVTTCAIEAKNLADFVWQPSATRQARLPRSRCGWLSPMYDMPALVASTAPIAGPGPPLLGVASTRVDARCGATYEIHLVATEGDTTLWKHRLEDRHDPCPVP